MGVVLLEYAVCERDDHSYTRVCERVSCRASREEDMYTHVYIERERERERERNIYVHINVCICIRMYVCIYNMYKFGERERERKRERERERERETITAGITRTEPVTLSCLLDRPPIRYLSRQQPFHQFSHLW